MGLKIPNKIEKIKKGLKVSTALNHDNAIASSPDHLQFELDKPDYHTLFLKSYNHIMLHASPLK